MMRNKTRRHATTITVVPHAVRQMHNGEAAAAGEAAVALNMRERESSLQVAGVPTGIGSVPAGSRLLLVHNASCGQMMLSVKGLDVSCGGTHVVLLDSEPVGACGLGDYVVIATAGRLWVLRADAHGSYSVLDPQAAVPHITLSEADAYDFTAGIAAVEFAEPYPNWPTALTVTDRETLQAQLRRGFSAAATSSAASGRFTGAVLARYGVRLFDDSYLFLSAPVMLGAATLASTSVTADVAVSDGKFAGVPAASLVLPSYALGITVHGGIPDCWHGIVKAVDVLVTDAVGMGLQGSSLICRSAVSTTGTRRNVLEFGLAAPSASAVAASLLGGKWRVVASTSHLSLLDSGTFAAANVGKSATVAFPSAVTQAMLAPMPSGIMLTSADAALIHARLSRLLVPSALALHGGRAMIGVGKWRCVNPWDLWQVCRPGAAQGGCSWTMTATLSTDHATAIVVSGGRLPFVPCAVSPLLAYPDARATHVRIQVVADADGAVTAWETDLWGVSGASMAVAYSTGFADNALVPVLECGSDVACNDCDMALGTVAVTAMGNPHVVESVHSVGTDTVLAIASACRPIYSSGFGRYPVYVFTRSALYALPQLTSGSYGDARLLRRGGIAEASPVAGGSDSVWFVSAGDGGLYRVDGAKSTCVARGLGVVVGLAWDNVHDELAVLSADSAVSMVSGATGRLWSRSLSASSLYGYDGRALAVTAGGEVLDFGNETEAASVSVCYRSHPIELNSGFPVRSSLAMWRLMSQHASVRLAVNGERGASCHGFVVGAVSASGSIDAPITVRLLSPPLRTVRLALSGTLPSGAMLLPVTLQFKSST